MVFWSYTIRKLRGGDCNIKRQIDPRTIRPTPACWEISIELHQSWWFRYSDNWDRKYFNCSVLHLTHIWSTCPSPLVTITTHCHNALVTVWGVTEKPLEPVYPVKEDILELQIHPQLPFQGNILMLNGALFYRTIRIGRHTIFNASLYNINQVIQAKDLDTQPLQEVVLEQYHGFHPLFNQILADCSPPHRSGTAHEVWLQECGMPSWGPLYSMSRAELIVLHKSQNDNMSKHFIPPSSSPLAASVQVAKSLVGVYHSVLIIATSATRLLLIGIHCPVHGNLWICFHILRYI